MPPAPVGKEGWPWDDGGETRSAPALDSEANWPRISVVTPSFNQGRYIEETIRSVLLQGYPNLEYIVMDGGSTDESVEIIRKYEPWLSFWKSAPDQGQTAAINAGLARATGDVVAYLNSDDVYEREALADVGRVFRENAPPWIYADFSNCDEDSLVTHSHAAPEFNLERLMLDNYIAQQTVFIRRDVWEHVRPFDESLQYAMDYDFWLRACAMGFLPRKSLGRTARFRLHGDSKTMTQKYLFLQDILQIFDGLFSRDTLPDDMRKVRDRAFSRVYWRAAACALRAEESERAANHVENGMDHYLKSPSPFELDLALSVLCRNGDGNWLSPAEVKRMWRGMRVLRREWDCFRTMLDEEYMRQLLAESLCRGKWNGLRDIIRLLRSDPRRAASWGIRSSLQRVFWQRPFTAVGNTGGS